MIIIWFNAFNPITGFKIYAKDSTNAWSLNDNSSSYFAYKVPYSANFTIPAGIPTHVQIDGPYGPLIDLNITLDETVEVNFTVYTEAPPGTGAPSNGVSFIQVNTSAIANFSTPATFRYYYNESDLPTGIDESELDIYVYNDSTGQWVGLNAVVNTTENYLEVTLTHFSFYAIIGKETGGGTSPPAPPIPGFEGMFLIMALVSLGAIYFVYKKRKIADLRV